MTDVDRHTKERKLIGKTLCNEGVIDSRDLKFALAERYKGENLLEALHRLGLLEGRVDEAYGVLAGQLGVHFFQEEVDFAWDAKLSQIVDQNCAQSEKLIPLKKEAGVLWLGMRFPQDITQIELMRVRTGLQVRGVLITPKMYLDGLEYLYGLSGGEQRLIRHKLLEDDEDNTGQENSAKGAEQKGKEEEEISTLFDLNSDGEGEGASRQLFRSVMLQAIIEGCSDIHCEPFRGEAVIRFRIDGVLHEKKKLSSEMFQPFISAIKVLANMDISERRLPQDGRISLHHETQDIDLRLSTLPTVFGEKLVIRLLRRGTGLLRLDRLGIDPQTEKILLNAIKEPNGIILVTGPTGSGKSTTLYSLLRELDLSHLNITTIEEPVEYQMNGVVQVDVRSDIGLNFSSVLRTVLRQDPDVIMLGEIRDAETAQMSIRAALTGHLVLSTLHTNSAAGTIDRLLDMETSAHLLAASVRLIAAQRLVRRVCPQCREDYTPNEHSLSLFADADLSNITFSHGKGCPECMGTGYRGRLALLETLVIKGELIHKIAQGLNSTQIREEATRLNLYDPIQRSGLLAVQRGETTLEEIVRVTGGL